MGGGRESILILLTGKRLVCILFILWKIKSPLNRMNEICLPSEGLPCSINKKSVSDLCDIFIHCENTHFKHALQICLSECGRQ